MNKPQAAMVISFEYFFLIDQNTINIPDTFFGVHGFRSVTVKGSIEHYSCQTFIHLSFGELGFCWKIAL